jgi:rhodanese-related sulfurtransferase
MTLLKKEVTNYVHCALGYRSMIFITILQARGYRNLIDIAVGFNALKETRKFKLTDYMCPSTFL